MAGPATPSPEKRAGQAEPASQPTIGTQPMRLDLTSPVHSLCVYRLYAFPILGEPGALFPYAPAPRQAGRPCDWQPEW